MRICIIPYTSIQNYILTSWAAVNEEQYITLKNVYKDTLTFDLNAILILFK